MPRRIMGWGNRNPFLTSLLIALALVLVMGAGIIREGRQRTSDLEREQAEDIALSAAEAEERAKAVVDICTIFARRVEDTFHETYDYIRKRRDDAPALDVLDEIAARNMNPSFCSPPALEEPVTTNP